MLYEQLSFMYQLASGLAFIMRILLLIMFVLLARRALAFK